MVGMMMLWEGVIVVCGGGIGSREKVVGVGDARDGLESEREKDE